MWDHTLSYSTFKSPSEGTCLSSGFRGNGGEAMSKQPSYRALNAILLVTGVVSLAAACRPTAGTVAGSAAMGRDDGEVRRCVSMPDEQWKRCGCHPGVRAAIDVIEGSGLKANSRRVLERCISEDVSGNISGVVSVRAQLAGCVKTRIELNPEANDAIANIATVLAKRPPRPNDLCNWNRCVFGPDAKCDEPACVSMPLEQWKKCGCHPSVRSAIDIIDGSGLKKASRRVVERCISEEASGVAAAGSQNEIASSLRKCLSTRIEVNESLASTIGSIATNLSTQRPDADDLCNWSRCVYGPTARCAGDIRVEVCDGVDNDADGQVDEEATDARIWYKDDDGDGVGTPKEKIRSCTPVRGYAETTGDCCDRDKRVFPGQSQSFGEASSCGGYDFNCDGRTTIESRATARCVTDPEAFQQCDAPRKPRLGSRGAEKMRADRALRRQLRADRKPVLPGNSGEQTDALPVIHRRPAVTEARSSTPGLGLPEGRGV